MITIFKELNNLYENDKPSFDNLIYSIADKLPDNKKFNEYPKFNYIPGQIVVENFDIYFSNRFLPKQICGENKIQILIHYILNKNNLIDINQDKNLKKKILIAFSNKYPDNLIEML